MTIKSILNRIKSDFFLADRIDEYEKIIQFALQNKYLIVSHSEYFELVKNNAIANKKILILRQDIDSDPKYVFKWLDVQKRYNIHSSMYFRLCTLHKNAMTAVQNSGSDCGYHYEEIADFAKENKLTNREEVMSKLPKISEKFKTNLAHVEQKVGFKIKHIASHGDFANRKLNLPNHRFVTPDLLNECKLDFEAYQSEFTSTYSINISDCGYPTFYKGDLTPIQAIEKEVPIIHFLIHPRHWRSSWYWNLYENIKRVKEGFFFR
ncbi:MAG TPA: hypothetical protein PLP27_02535 [Crocinitomicaceae bacterium]|jgi:hypothetical protein|nr:hypothetical protein [Crocinitomicaceae bacterium]